MKEHAIDGDYRQWVTNTLRQSPFFAGADAALLDKVLGHGRLVECDAQDALIKQGEVADAFYIMIMGEASIFVNERLTGEAIETARVRPVECVGEMSLVLNQRRVASVVAVKPSYLVRFPPQVFAYMFENVPGFAKEVTQNLARRLNEQTSNAPMPEISRDQLKVPDAALVDRFPAALLTRERVLPLAEHEGFIFVGYVDRPSREVLNEVRSHFAGTPVRSYRIAARDYDDFCEALGRQPVGGGGRPSKSANADPEDPAALRARRKRSTLQTSVVASVGDLSRLEPLLRRMIDARASDLHMSAGQPVRWRIDGDMVSVPETSPPSATEVYKILSGLLPERARDEFDLHHDCDFAFALEGTARFRVNMFRDEAGVGAVFRLVPMVIPSMDEVGLPKGAQNLTNLAQGLILVCGPTGSGKSTTLGAMVDAINKGRRSHIVTIEDPIEFHHPSQTSMVTQREVGKNTSSFQRALRSALREDPDIVLVGELRDLETMALAMETAQTGHLVLSTLHTSTAIGTIDRIIDMFPVEQHTQVRSTLAEVLKGVINQNLCRKIGGGRVASFETLIVSSAVANCIRAGKNTQIATIMTTNRAAGNCTMNEDLESLVRSSTITPSEAILRSPDRKDMRQRLNMSG